MAKMEEEGGREREMRSIERIGRSFVRLGHCWISREEEEEERQASI